MNGMWSFREHGISKSCILFYNIKFIIGGRSACLSQSKFHNPRHALLDQDSLSREAADYLGCYYSTISVIVKRVAEKKKHQK